MSTAFENLTIGEIKALTQEQVDEYAPELGKEYFEKNSEEFYLKIGRRIIADKQAQLRAINKDLTGDEA